MNLTEAMTTLLAYARQNNAGSLRMVGRDESGSATYLVMVVEGPDTQDMIDAVEAVEAIWAKAEEMRKP